MRATRGVAWATNTLQARPADRNLCSCRRFYVPEPVSILLATLVQGSAGLLSAERAGFASYGPICCGARAPASSAPGPAVCHAICCTPGGTSCPQWGQRLSLRRRLPWRSQPVDLGTVHRLQGSVQETRCAPRWTGRVPTSGCSAPTRPVGGRGAGYTTQWPNPNQVQQAHNQWMQRQPTTSGLRRQTTTSELRRQGINHWTAATYR
mmetsp:Transcript_31494/g.51086  ORF Transcript_31494/g.51086 Transcript_31494/m.51086 type:complete len:207 (-) Transcript_31494:165-785(-)